MGTENPSTLSGSRSASDQQKCEVRDTAANLGLAKVIEHFKHLKLSASPITGTLEYPAWVPEASPVSYLSVPHRSIRQMLWGS